MAKNRFIGDQGPNQPRTVQSIDLDDFYDVKDALAEPTINGYGLISTPKLVMKVDHGRHFEMAATPERDALAFRLADESSRRRTAMTSARTPMRSPSLFSPAGQKLLEARLRGTTPVGYFKSPALGATPGGSVAPPLGSTPNAGKADSFFATPSGPARGK